MEAETYEAAARNLVHALDLVTGSGGKEKQRLRTAYGDVRDAARRLVRDEFWQGRVLAAELLDHTLELGAQVETELDENGEWRVRETAADMRQLLDAMREERERDRLEDPAAAAQYLATTLAGVDQERLAGLVGVDVRTLRAWRSKRPSTVRKRAERIVLLAQLVSELSRSLAPRGIVLWLVAPHPELDGRAPRDLLDDPAARAALTAAARGARGQLAA